MALRWRTCCGCCGVKPGSNYSAIYSMVIAIFGVLNFGVSVLNIQTYRQSLYDLKKQYPDMFSDFDIESYVIAMKAEYIYALVFLGLLLVTSTLAIVGIQKDTKELLIPFLVNKILGFVWYLFALVLSCYYIAMLGSAIAGVAVIALIILLLPFGIADFFCFVCVWSQYQEYRDGAGRQTGTTVVIEQTAPVASGGFAYRQMEDDAPPAYKPPATTSSINPI